MPQRALFLVNRSARSGAEAHEQARRLLEEGGLSLVEEPQGNDLSDMIRAHRNDVDLVVVGGGDGTLNHAIAGLVDTKLPLGILPLGTANDLARTLGIPTDLSAASKIILAQKSQVVDVGMVNDRHFFNVASLGLTVRLTRRLGKESKKRWGPLAYPLTAARILLEAEPFLVRVRAGTEAFEVEAVQIAIGNGRHYGGGMTIAEDASISDHLLDFCSIEATSRLGILKLLPAMRAGKFQNEKWARSFKALRIELQTQRPHEISTDGEITTRTPAVFQVIPSSVRVLVP